MEDFEFLRKKVASEVTGDDILTFKDGACFFVYQLYHAHDTLRSLNKEINERVRGIIASADSAFAIFVKEISVKVFE